MPLVALLKEIARFLKAVDRKLPREFRGHIKAIICLIFALAMIQEVRGAIKFVIPYLEPIGRIITLLSE